MPLELRRTLPTVGSLIHGSGLPGKEFVDGDMVESSIKEGIGSDKGIQDETWNGNGISDAVLEECCKKSDDGNNKNAKNGVENNQSTYASKLNANNNNDGNKLFFVQPVLKPMVKRMFVNELKYNTRRMWGRLGLKDIVVDADEMCFFKFKSEEKMNLVLDQSPWLVNGKHMIMQKLDPETIIVKEAPCKIPVWIRLYNVPLEAWSINGISTISSRLGMPVKMDHMTVEMCKEGYGRLGYARVLVEIDASKAYVDKVEIDYVDNNMNVK
ncbi:RNA-directed DNA polymerase, eukaryota, reverse transcriptase zinc-binding domain protein, partial [Tanacetum coccineum]